MIAIAASCPANTTRCSDASPLVAVVVDGRVERWHRPCVDLGIAMGHPVRELVERTEIDRRATRRPLTLRVRRADDSRRGREAVRRWR